MIVSVIIWRVVWHIFLIDVRAASAVGRQYLAFVFSRRRVVQKVVALFAGVRDWTRVNLRSRLKWRTIGRLVIWIRIGAGFVERVVVRCGRRGRVGRGRKTAGHSGHVLQRVVSVLNGRLSPFGASIAEPNLNFVIVEAGILAYFFSKRSVRLVRRRRFCVKLITLAKFLFIKIFSSKLCASSSFSDKELSADSTLEFSLFLFLKNRAMALTLGTEFWSHTFSSISLRLISSGNARLAAANRTRLDGPGLGITLQDFTYTAMAHAQLSRYDTGPGALRRQLDYAHPDVCRKWTAIYEHAA
ncbi:hypothetical protein BpHYR1_015952, partial [Brachionus plicatilis]